MVHFRKIRDLAAALLATLLLFVVFPAQAQTITNVAGAQWRVGGQEQTTISNEVSFDVVDPGVRI